MSETVFTWGPLAVQSLILLVLLVWAFWWRRVVIWNQIQLDSIERLLDEMKRADNNWCGEQIRQLELISGNRAG